MAFKVLSLLCIVLAAAAVDGAHARALMTGKGAVPLGSIFDCVLCWFIAGLWEGQRAEVLRWQKVLELEVAGGTISTAITGGTAGSQSGSGTTTSTGSTTTFTSKLPALAIGTASLGTSVQGGSGPTVGSVSSNTFGQVVAPGSLSTALGSSTAGFAGSGSSVNGKASTTDTSIATSNFATNSIKTGAIGSSNGPVGTAVSFNSFSQDP
ncbi:hypothetical protein BSKO_10389 [Bryopsis sp. KO-2023]|nr:hypothetical protein BSKO_10389 [Bryopsis sp. KO-2023]